MPIINPDYTPPIEMTFDEGKPIRSEQGLMLAGNLIAAFMGKPGAPRLYGTAAVPRSQQTELGVLSLTASDAVTLDGLHYLGDFVNTSTGFGTGVSPWNGAGVITSVLMTGEVRFVATQTSSGSNFTGQIRLLKNGTVVQTFSLSSGSDSASAVRTIDVSIAVGDTFEWQVRRIDGPGTASISSMRIRANDGYTRIGIPIKVSDM